MRYVGAGGSPKADDPGTLKPGQFTLSAAENRVLISRLRLAENGRSFGAPAGRLIRRLSFP
jgi:hypothetical protein